MLPAIQLTLKNLQLDYLDLYLIHSPFAFRHGANFANLKEEDKLGYDESRVSGIWKVEIHSLYYAQTPMHHTYRPWKM